MNFYRGYLYFSVEGGQHIFFISNIDLDTEVHNNFIVTFVLDESDEPQLQDIKGLGKDTPPEFSQSYVDILNFVSFRVTHESQITLDCYLDDPWKTRTQVYHCSSAAPFFGFLDIALKDDVPTYTLDRAGSMSIDDVDDFFTIRPLDRSLTREHLYNSLMIQERTSRLVPLGPGMVSLDDRWSANDSLLFPGYWFSYEGVRDSQLMLESQKMSIFNKLGITSLERFAALTLPFVGNVHYDTFQVRYEKNILLYECYLEDDHGVRNYQRLYSWIEDGVLFSCRFPGFF